MSVTVGQCNHCDAFILNPQADECPSCGREIYPVTKKLEDGAYVRLVDGQARLFDRERDEKEIA